MGFLFKRKRLLQNYTLFYESMFTIWLIFIKRFVSTTFLNKKLCHKYEFCRLSSTFSAEASQNPVHVCRQKVRAISSQRRMVAPKKSAV